MPRSLSPAAVVSSWRLAALGAVATTAGEGAVVAEVTTPLMWGDDPAIALPYDRSDLARSLQRSGRAVLVCWDSRLAEKGWQPLAAAVQVAVSEDHDGAWVEAGLLAQELRAHPPSRALLDTPLLRREHWWYLPRWIIRATAVEQVWSVGRRDGARTGMMAWDDADGLHADVVAVEGWQGEAVHVRSVAGRDLTHAIGPAALLAHDVRTPDLDHTAELRISGYLRGSAVQVSRRSGAAELGAPPSLWRRLQQARRLERACRRGLARPTTG